MPTPRRLALMTALLVAAIRAEAQDYTAERNGMSATLGVGLSSAGLTCSPRCSGDRRTGPTFQLRGAAAVSPQFTLVVEGNTFQQSVETPSGPGNWRLTWVTIGFLWYPHEDEDLFLKVGVGGTVLHANATFDTVGALDLNTRDLGFVVGVGRDYRLSANYGFTLYADYSAAPRSVAYLHDVDSGARMGGDVLNLGLGFSVF